MRIGLQARYAIAILGLTLGVTLILSTVLLVEFKTGSDRLVEDGRDLVTRELTAGMENHAKSTANQLAENLANPLLYYQMDKISDLLEVVKGQPMVEAILVFDPEGKILHDGTPYLKQFGELAPISNSQLEAIRSRESTLVHLEDRLLVYVPVVLGDDVLGGVLVTNSKVNILADIEALHLVTKAQSEHGLKQHIARAILTALLLILLAAAVSIYLARSFNRPIQKLLGFTKQVSEGTFEPVVMEQSFDELGDLAQGLNEMAANLEQRREQIEHLAFHDSLTDLPNRRYFTEILDNSIHEAEKSQKPFALLFIDLDDFKVINDTLGHDAGDLVIKAIAERTSKCIRDKDFLSRDKQSHRVPKIARLGGDEFVILLKDLHDAVDAATVAKRIIAAISRPLQIDGKATSISASIGIALYPENGRNSESLLRSADQAMYNTKLGGKNDYRFFSESVDLSAHQQLAVITELEGAIGADQLEIWYQPRFDIFRNRLVGAEALVRWEHPQKGTLLPGEFIPLIENREIVQKLGTWVLERVSEELSMFRQHEKDFQMSVNISASQLQRGSLINALNAINHSFPEESEKLHLEITETFLLKEEASAQSLLETARSMGHKIWLDDFGTGYSAISHLRRFPVDGVKIDKSFVMEMDSKSECREVTAAIIAMAHAMGLETVAEGVESESQYQELKRLGCKLAQGYLLGRPMILDSFVEQYIRGDKLHKAGKLFSRSPT